MGSSRSQSGRPIFVVSMPRSGSSWIGSLLGLGPDIQYLREPFTRTYVTRHSGESMVEFDIAAPPEIYLDVKQRIQAGSAAFRPSVLAHLSQWPPYSHGPARMVIKEVNPFACGWFFQEYKPVLIFLTRHPADIALSFQERGWWDAGGDQLRRLEEFGRRVAKCWCAAINHAEGHDQFLHVKYEDLCLDTEGVLETVYGFCGREMSPSVRSSVQELSSATADDTENPYDIHRNSRKQVDKWRDKLTQEEAEALCTGFESVQLPDAYCYQFDRGYAAQNEDRDAASG
ncbi:sulfotransferase family protein [Ruegeria atlantica]|uniref:sulfotransferase family protein n=1 Tax=Ruegeria atlantica TaxID=81569 RepID=UPI0026708EF6|nr:sulfotransferase [Ruegeria atlantica]